MELIKCDGIKKSFGEVDVLKEINFSIKKNESIGLVGNNGAGKTTLANIIFGKIKSDKGNIHKYIKNINIGYLAQSTSYKLNTNNFLDNVLVKNENPNEILKFTSNLGLDKVHMWNKERFKGLSGGEKTKLALANVWASKPDLLILDEPTNHMDFKGVEWLIEELKKFKKAILIISHDRYFLDKSVKRIIELEEGKINDYDGNYSYYREEKKRRYENKLHLFNVEKKKQEKIELEITKLKNWSEKAHRDSTKKASKLGNMIGAKEHFRKKAKKRDNQIKSKIKKLEKMKEESIEKPKEEQSINFGFYIPKNRGQRVIEAKSINKGYKDNKLFKDSSFYIKSGERIGLFGANGCGKTTLIKIILENEKLDSGDIWVSPSINIGYLSQELNDLNEEITTLELLESIDKLNTLARTLFANMGFDREMLKRPIKNLSLGERTRIKLATLILKRKDFLILDEPTNHLDLHSREKLEKALLDYKGTILVVSHDRYLLEKLCDKMLVFESNKIKRYERGFKGYKNKTKHDNLDLANELMIIENKITDILGKINDFLPEDEEYKRLDNEFKELIKQKKELKSNI